MFEILLSQLFLLLLLLGIVGMSNDHKKQVYELERLENKASKVIWCIVDLKACCKDDCKDDCKQKAIEYIEATEEYQRNNK